MGLWCKSSPFDLPLLVNYFKVATRCAIHLPCHKATGEGGGVVGIDGEGDFSVISGCVIGGWLKIAS